VGCGYVGLIGLTQDRDRWQMPVSVVMHCGNAPSGSVKCGEFLE